MPQQVDPRQLLEQIVIALVDNGEVVEVKDESPGTKVAMMTIKVDDREYGRVIGKQGKTIAALRDIFVAVCAAQGRKGMIEVLDKKSRFNRGEQRQAVRDERTAR